MATRRRPMIIAVDGPAGSGKTTIARALSRRLELAHVDTGAIYRCLGLLARRRDVPLEDEAALAELLSQMAISFVLADGEQRVLLGEEDVTDAIRAHDISYAASKVSAWPKVRSLLLELQRSLALGGGRGGAVLEGRDIGTVVFPDADLKIFLTASAEERARRRYEELRKKGADVSWEEVTADQAARDEQDSSREVAPLEPARDAVVFDSTGLAVTEVVDRLESLAKEVQERDNR